MYKKFLIFVFGILISANWSIFYAGTKDFETCVIGKNVSDSSVTLSEKESKAVSSLAKNCGLSEEKLKSLFSFKASKKNCFLVPVCNCSEHLKCFLNIFSYANPDYMKYYLNGVLMKPNYVNNWFARTVKNLDKDSPRSISFLVKVENEVVARIGLGPLNDRKGVDTEIGYAILKDYSGKGIMGESVNCTLKFLSYLRTKGKSVYNYKRIRATAKKENKASNAILSNHGFVLSKKSVNNGRENEYFYYFK